MDEQEAKKPEKKDHPTLEEDKAKGHLGKPQGEMPGEEYKGVDRSERPQKGFGKNQGRESEDRSTDFGTRAAGSEHG